MSDEVCALALRNTLNEVQSICPDIKNAFVFRENGQVVARDANTPDITVVEVINAFDGVLEKADSINGVEGLVLEGSKGKIIISSMNDLYLVTVASGKPDMKYLNTVTRVLIPTVLKLVETFNSAPLKNNLPESEPESPAHLEVPRFQVAESEEQSVEESLQSEPKEPFESQIKPEPVVPEPPVNQLIVENLGGLLVPADTVRVDNGTLSQWTAACGDKKIEEVEIETFDGKIVRCKVKPIKESKYEGKGIVQMPEKVQLVLEIRKGELVRVRPATE